MRIIAILLLLALAGCAHKLTLMERGTGIISHGTVPGSWDNSGNLTIEIEGLVYTGTWVLSSGGGMSLMNTYGSQISTSVGFFSSGQGVGNAMLHAPDGSSLRCQFQYSDWTATGIGVCVSSDGRVFDMQIKQ